MKVSISKKIHDLYKSTHKNMEYTLTNVVNGFDPECCAEALKVVATFSIEGEKQELEISKELEKLLNEVFGKDFINNQSVELLLWVALLLPEI